MGVAEWWSRYMAQLERATRPRSKDGAQPSSVLSGANTFEAERLRELNVLSLVLHSTGTAEEMLSALVEKAPNVADAIAVYPLLLDKRREVLHAHHLEQCVDQHLDKLNAALEIDLTEVEYSLPPKHARRQALEEGDTVVLGRLRDFGEDIFGKRACEAAQKRLSLSRIALVPMVLDGDPLGVLVFFFENETFDQQVMELLTGHATLALRALTQLEEMGRFGNIDQMTWLLNRRAFTLELERELRRAERFERAFTCVFLDIENFVRFNKEHGPSLGDRLLRSVGMILGDIVKPPDVAARFGDDEFAVLLPETNRAAAIATTTAIRARLSQVTVFGEGEPETVSAAMVMVCYPEDGVTAKDLIASAEADLEETKREARQSSRRRPRKLPVLAEAS